MNVFRRIVSIECYYFNGYSRALGFSTAPRLHGVFIDLYMSVIVFFPFVFHVKCDDIFVDV